MEKRKNITRKRLLEFLNNVAEYKEVERVPNYKAYAWSSKIDGSYISTDEEGVRFLYKRGVTEQIQNTRNLSEATANIGFNPVEQKWYGWSHRAIFGFGIGSEVKMGDCAFMPSNKLEFTEDALRFWGDLDMEDTYKSNPTACEAEQDGALGVLVEYTYTKDVPNKEMAGEKGSMFCSYPREWGKGAWTAQTMEDAKQMAIDFARSVS